MLIPLKLLYAEIYRYFGILNKSGCSSILRKSGLLSGAVEDEGINGWRAAVLHDVNDEQGGHGQHCRACRCRWINVLSYKTATRQRPVASCRFRKIIRITQFQL